MPLSNRRYLLSACLVGLLSLSGCQPPFDAGASSSCDGQVADPTEERIGVMESKDGGVTWAFLGHACFHAPELIPVDPAPAIQDGKVVLYFFDISSLRTGQSAGVQHVMYRATTDQGLDFSEPTVAFSTTDTIITDPTVIQLPDDSYRMYISAGNTVLSAISADGVSFTAEDGLRSTVGGVPGILGLPDGRCRLFVCGAGGIISLVSTDGISFTAEDGTRIASSGDILCDPHPIRLLNGGYIMTFKERAAGEEGPDNDQVYLARSDDGLTWVPENEPIVTGSVPGIVETDDGTLVIYYVDFSS